MEKISAHTLLRDLHTPEKLESKFEVLPNSKSIYDKKIEGSLVIHSSKFTYDITFENCHFEGLMLVDVEWTGFIFFENCKFSMNFDVSSIVAPNLKFENCTFEKSLIFNYCDISYLTFLKNECSNGIQFNAGIIRILLIEPLSDKTQFTLIGKFLFINSLTVKSNTGITLVSKSCIINQINLSGYFNTSSRLDFNSILNKQIYLDEMNNDGKIYFSNITAAAIEAFKQNSISEYIESFAVFRSNNIKYEQKQVRALDKNLTIVDLIKGYHSLIEFKKFIEQNYYNDFLLWESYPTYKFKITNSSAGILEFKNIQFENYDIELKNSDLNSLKLINSKIPHILYRDNYLNYYNVYNDLYTSANKQSNTKDKVYYYRISQHFLLQHLRFEDSKPKDYGSIITIIVSGLYSNHGTNWLKAIFITILVSFIFFLLFINTIEGISLSLDKTGASFFIENLLPYFPQFLNPLHKIEFMEKSGTLTSWSGLIDLLGRIFTGIGVFEMIRSFRKHVRQ
ncbi:hypothetical protein [Flavobacterium sp. 1355]|uniref:hypothetical protein n=1 Tax=Flavobacterium sp. 1355 TaxID=2806571 RepID=UPI001AE18430|nr:hypothetical protein [Flavobacterium sp. 1355]MBP1222637.1 hypothetical protein [Flavobacterium sp. 1355]